MAFGQDTTYTIKTINKDRQIVGYLKINVLNNKIISTERICCYSEIEQRGLRKKAKAKVYLNEVPNDKLKEGEYLKNRVMKDIHKVAIIGNGSIRTCLAKKIKDLDKEMAVVQNENILEQGNNVYQFKNYHFLDSRNPSKNQLRKCEKGLHEFQETQFTTTENSIVKKQWFCKHCGVSMHNR